MAHMVLQHYWRSSCSWRLRWALALKDLPYQSEHVDLLQSKQRTASFRQHNPQGLVPVLLVDGVPHYESLAIMEWLDERYPQVPLLPASSVERLQARQLAYMVSCNIQPLQNLNAQRYYSNDPQARLRYARHYIERGFAAYEQRLQQLTAGTFCLGGQVTLADICLIPQVYNAMRFACDMQQFPTIARIYHNCMHTHACQVSAPEACKP